MGSLLSPMINGGRSARKVFCVLIISAINLIRQLLNKDPNERPDAKDIEGHIWLSHVEPIQKQISDFEEVNLYKTIHKVKRFIYKDKLKRTNKKMKDLMDAPNLSKTRLHFLAYESEDLYS